eukprot:TRINITY_DN67665_c0_g1_i1.p1 TRINITY_DN67665_c0_g1~~TRINITY_DN67665_c0_g1_i1.p1  ORF type:complete len:304 (-),score=65.06 TRINITY_DN67665_c0_g1_i1:200-1111(-)
MAQSTVHHVPRVIAPRTLYKTDERGQHEEQGKCAGVAAGPSQTAKQTAYSSGAMARSMVDHAPRVIAPRTLNAPGLLETGERRQHEEQATSTAVAAGPSQRAKAAAGVMPAVALAPGQQAAKQPAAPVVVVPPAQLQQAKSGLLPAPVRKLKDAAEDLVEGWPTYDRDMMYAVAMFSKDADCAVDDEDDDDVDKETSEKKRYDARGLSDEEVERRLEAAGIPSLGSIYHGSACKPCKFYFQHRTWDPAKASRERPPDCQKGRLCKHCHGEHEDDNYCWGGKPKSRNVIAVGCIESQSATTSPP